MKRPIIRPSGVWNTRTPLHWFLEQAIRLQQTYALLTLAVSRTRYDAEHLEADSAHSASKFMHARHSGPVASKAWNTYRWAWRALEGAPEGQPAIKDVERDLAVSLYAIREYAVVRHSSLFESFVQSWALNMLLALQEREVALSSDQNLLADQFSPVLKEFVLTPGVPKILAAFPEIRATLEALPHISSDPRTKEPVEVPSSPKLNALTTIKFWRNFRNDIIHCGGRVSTGFARSHAEFFDLFRAPYGSKLRALEHGHLLQLPNEVYYAIAATHRKVAVRLNLFLQELSQGRRGNVYKPEDGRPEPALFQPGVRTRPLLIVGDHPESFAFVDQFTDVPDAVAADNDDDA